MNRRMFLVMTMLLAAATVPAAAQDTIESVTASMEARYRQLFKAKLQGLVGETHEGFVAAVKSGAPQDLIRAENADRRKLYALLAEKEGTTPAQVAEVNATRNFRKAHSEEWLLPPSGQWVQRKNLK